MLIYNVKMHIMSFMRDWSNQKTVKKLAGPEGPRISHISGNIRAESA